MYVSKVGTEPAPTVYHFYEDIKIILTVFPSKHP